MAVWYENEGYGVYNGMRIDRYTLLVLYKQGISYVIIRGE